MAPKIGIARRGGDTPAGHDVLEALRIKDSE